MIVTLDFRIIFAGQRGTERFYKGINNSIPGSGEVNSKLNLCK